jgi:hypothetical protein
VMAVSVLFFYVRLGWHVVIVIINLLGGAAVTGCVGPVFPWEGFCLPTLGIGRVLFLSSSLFRLVSLVSFCFCCRRGGLGGLIGLWLVGWEVAGLPV